MGRQLGFLPILTELEHLEYQLAGFWKIGRGVEVLPGTELEEEAVDLVLLPGQGQRSG